MPDFQTVLADATGLSVDDRIQLAGGDLLAGVVEHSPPCHAAVEIQLGVDSRSQQQDPPPPRPTSFGRKTSVGLFQQFASLQRRCDALLRRYVFLDQADRRKDQVDHVRRELESNVFFERFVGGCVGLPIEAGEQGLVDVVIDALGVGESAPPRRLAMAVLRAPPWPRGATMSE